MHSLKFVKVDEVIGEEKRKIILLKIFNLNGVEEQYSLKM